MKRIIFLASLVLMGSSLPTLKYRALDSNGDPLSGAKLYFYETGTTTPLATYSDEDLASANANPVVADANGWFGEIYLKTDEAYRVVLKTSADVTQWTLDGIYATQLVSADFVTRIKQIASNPLDYGAVGDGVADESSYVQSAIDNSTGIVDLLGKTYRCDDKISVPGDTVFRNGTIDLSNNANNPAFEVAGTIGGQVLLTANGDIGDSTITVASSSGVSSGDWIVISSDDVHISGGVPADEMAQVESVGSPTSITLTEGLEAAYTTANNAYFKKYSMDGNTIFDNVKFISGSSNMIKLQYATNISFRDCRFSGGNDAMVTVDHSSMVSFSGCEFYDSDGGATSVELLFTGPSKHLTVYNSSFSTAEYGIMAAGSPVRHINVSNCRFSGVENGVYLGDDTSNGSLSVDDAVVGATITNSVFTKDGGAASDGAISAETASDIKILNNEFMKLVTRAVNMTSLNTVVEGTITISGNKSADSGFYITESSNAEADISSVNISNNQINGAGFADIEIIATSTGQYIDSVNVSGNTIFRDRIKVTGTEILKASFVGNNMVETATAEGAIVISGVGDTTISGNSFAGFTIMSNEFVSLSDTSAVITGNTFDASSTLSPADGIKTDDNDVDHLSISGNIFIGNNDGIDVGSLLTLSISGNQFYDLEGDVISVTGTGKFSIASNVIEHSGSNGIYVDAGTVAIDGAVVSSNTVDGGQCIYLDAGSGSGVGMSVTGNSCVGAALASQLVVVGKVSDLVISGNMIVGNDSYDSISLQGDGAGYIDQVTINGNTIIDGDYCIGEPVDANNTNVYVSGNLFSSCASGEVEGTVTAEPVLIAAANTACNTTCGSYTCEFGIDTAGAGAAAVCTDASADVCICHP